MLLVLAIAPLVLGVTRKVKARLLRRIGPPIWQPYLDLWKLMHKEAVLAHNASWLYRVGALSRVRRHLGCRRAGADLCDQPDVLLVGRPHCDRRAAGDRPVRAGARRHGRRHRVRRHRLVARDDDRLAGRARDAAGGVHRRAGRRHHAALSHRRDIRHGPVGLRVSLGLALFAFVFVAIAENARIPIDNPATHLELTMVHEAMVLEYSGRHLAMIEAAAALKLVLYFSLLVCLFVPFGMATADKSLDALVIGLAAYLAKIVVLAVAAADRRDRGRQDAGVPLSDFPRRRVRRRRARRVPPVRVAGASDAHASPSTSRICSPAACWC